ncbi:MAG: homoserine dehydrogenase [Christensenellaceae bacterium]|jgi:homoserine dehydrogenase|nr:homoserine dehydrogenase [Christensenellaceae bacterium]
MKKIGVALLGLGVVGSSTYRILTEQAEYIKKNHGIDIKVIHILEKNMDRVEELGIDKSIVSTDITNITDNKDIQIVAEFFGGIEPARSFLLSALNSGKSIVTANKELFSKHRIELIEASKKGGGGIFFEASCVGGVPIIRTLTAGLQGDQILSIAGIFNGTTNFILSKMSNEKMEYSQALSEAQRLGFAEADPTADVEGYDTMYKLSILSSLAFHKSVPIDKIYREGISLITIDDINYGKEFGYTLKLLAIGKNINGKIEARVHPAFVENAHPLASVAGSFNAVMLEGSNVGDIMLYGRGAGGFPTGSAIVSDIVFCAKNPDAGLDLFDNSPVSNSDFSSDFLCRYYIRTNVSDESGVLANIAKIFGEYDISISSMHQMEPSSNSASIIFFTHVTSELSINKAIAKIKALNVVNSVDAVIRLI